MREVWVKNDAANPTHSFKDRVVSVAVARARELGFDTLACASTGNLANAVAAHGAALGMQSYVFIPSDLEEQKILATGVYGTNLVKVNGNYDDVNRLCTELSGERDWAFVNVNMRPYYAEGSKTLAYEIAEQLGWEMPDRVVAPIASGSLFTKIAKGFEDWLDLGLVDGRRARHERRPGRRLLAGRQAPSPTASTSAGRSSPTRSPSRWPSATRPTARTRSSSRAAAAASIDAVTDDEIRAGIRLLAETTGIFTETAGGVTTATLAKLADARRHRPRRARRARHHRRRPQDARRGPRHLRGATRSRPPSTSSSPRSRARQAPRLMPTGQAADAAARRRRRRGAVERRRRHRRRGPRGALRAPRELRDRLSDGDGGLRRFVNVYVDGEDIRFGDGLDTPVDDGGRSRSCPP